MLHLPAERLHTSLLTPKFSLVYRSSPTEVFLGKGVYKYFKNSKENIQKEVSVSINMWNCHWPNSK